MRSLLLALGVVVALIIAVTLWYSQGSELLHRTTGFTETDASSLPQLAHFLVHKTLIALGIL